MMADHFAAQQQTAKTLFFVCQYLCSVKMMFFETTKVWYFPIAPVLRTFACVLYISVQHLCRLDDANHFPDPLTFHKEISHKVEL